MYVKKISDKKYFDLYELLKQITEERRVFAQEIKEDLKNLDDNNKFSLQKVNISLRKMKPFDSKIEQIERIIFLCHEMDKPSN